MAERMQTRTRLLQIVDRFASRRIVVAGDLIADQFLYGRISRVSREAPVLVLEYLDMVRLPGGAANAASNLLALGCAATVIGAVGCDRPGTDLVSSLEMQGADVRHVARVASYSTPVKTRILASAHHSSPQQIVRVDREARLDPAVRPRWGRMRRLFRAADGIIVSDYGYGAAAPADVPEIREAVRPSRIPIVVDSRFRMGEFQGVDSMTPNITELEASAGVQIGGDQALLHRVARRALSRQKLRSILVTQGRFGMTLIQPRRPPMHIPIYGTDEVADVTGAGDTVIAVFTLALACGAVPGDAARLANYAGGIVVMKRGTATVSREELSHAVSHDSAA
jgi:rfaE bifunctional protein kinase chain/domain